MANRFAAELMELQDALRETMITWNYHRTGVRPITDPQAFERLLIASNFALANIRLDIMAHERETAGIVEGLQQQLEQSAKLLREAMTLFDRVIGAPAAPVAPIVPSNVLVFTGSYHPQPANDPAMPGGVF
jgi:hypothetical protein